MEEVEGLVGEWEGGGVCYGRALFWGPPWAIATTRRSGAASAEGVALGWWGATAASAPPPRVVVHYVGIKEVALL